MSEEYKKIVNEVLMDMTPEEITQRQSDVAKAEAEKIVEQETVNNRTSGKAKLKAGESLTDDEISALFGDN